MKIKKCIYCGNGHQSREEFCGGCKKVRGLYKSDNTLKARLRREAKLSCDDIQNWRTEIKLLYIKRNNDLLSEIDFFRIVNIYMTVLCKVNAYDTLSPDQQVIFMIDELWNKLNSPWFNGAKDVRGAANPNYKKKSRKK